MPQARTRTGFSTRERKARIHSAATRHGRGCDGGGRLGRRRLGAGRDRRLHVPADDPPVRPGAGDLLEPLALTESIPHLSEDDLKQLERLQEQIEADTGLGEFLALDREFHLMTYTGCQIDQLSSMVVRLWNTTQHYRRAFMKVGGSERRWVINAEHRLLLDAIQRRDAVDAERHLAGHIRRTRIELSRHPEVFEGPIP
jgi:hypothetical protein